MTTTWTGGTPTPTSAARSDVGCEERDKFGRLMGGEEEDRTPSTSVGGGAATKGGTTVVGGAIGRRSRSRI
jgi:hypothetical protein